MDHTSKSSKEAQHKIVYFLKEEVEKLKFDHELEPKKKFLQRKNLDKKRHKLYQKVESVLKIYPLDAEVKEVLLSIKFAKTFPLE